MTSVQPRPRYVTTVAEMPQAAEILQADNPAFAAWRVAYGESSPYNRYWQVIDDCWGGPGGSDGVATRHYIRRDVCNRWAWAVPSPEALDLIAFHAGRNGVVEVGAGLGYWASLLSKLGVDIIASDLLSAEGRARYFDADARPHHTVVRADAAEFAATHAHRTLLLVWPPYAESMGARAVEAYWLAGGRKIIYVGESWGGCCGDDRMHHLLGDGYDEDDYWEEREQVMPRPRFRVVQRSYVPQWDGIHDTLSIHERIDYPELTRAPS